MINFIIPSLPSLSLSFFFSLPLSLPLSLPHSPLSLPFSLSLSLSNQLIMINRTSSHPCCQLNHFHGSNKLFTTSSLTRILSRYHQFLFHLFSSIISCSIVNT